MRPSKPIELVKGHRTKAEKKIREKAESLLVTGIKMRECPSVKADEKAHAYYLRVRKTFEKIGKNDALNEAVLNRFCMLRSECERYEEKDLRLHGLMDQLYENQSDMEFETFIKHTLNLNKQIQTNDKLLQVKRKMLLDIEKENVMTIASQLRSIPKKPQEEEDDGMAAFLRKRRAADAG
jgi:phage terminase small subunit